jgi:hypothetical protein
MEELTAKFTLVEQEPIKATFKIDVTPTKLSELENDMGYITSDEVELPDIDLSDYATKDELEGKQPKGDYALKSDIPKTVLITQADYDALATKEANTLYLIEE